MTRSYANDGWQITHTDEYFNLSGLTYTTDPSLGTENTHFYRTEFAYDDPGRLSKTTAPTGTITKTDYDDLGRPIAVSVGTSDVNMVQVTTYEYDGGGVGDGNLTNMTQHPGGGEADRQTDFFYDWRNRLVATKAGVETIEDDAVNRPIVYMEYDYLNQVIAVEQYDGDGEALRLGRQLEDFQGHTVTDFLCDGHAFSLRWILVTAIYRFIIYYHKPMLSAEGDGRNGYFSSAVIGIIIARDRIAA